MQAARRLRARARVLVVCVVASTLALAAVAVADIVTVNDVETNGDASKQVGQTGTVRLVLQNSNRNASTPTDPEGCNAGGNTTNAVVFNVRSSNPSAVTLSQSQVTFTDCGNTAGGAKTVGYTAAGAGSSTISASYASGGKDGARLATAYNTQDTATITVTAVTPPPPADTTPPVVTPKVTGTLGDNGWYTGNASVSWTVTDGESTISSRTGCNDGSVTTDTSGTTFTCTATSAGGTTSESVTVARDATAPVIARNAAADECSLAGANDWCRGTQTAAFRASDVTAGLADPTQAAFTKSSATNGGAVQIASGTVKDAAGNTAASIDAGPFKIDSIAPVVSRDTSADACALAGDDGWCRGSQTAGFAASDATSGLPAGGAEFTRSSAENGAAVQIASGAVSDVAGNTAASIDAGPFKVDTVAPAITGSRLPAANAAGWNNGTVTVSFLCSDGTSGLAAGACPAAGILSTEGRDQSVTGTVKDRAGNEASDTVGDIDIDRTAPSAPVATTTPAAPVANSGGWFKDTVTVSYGGSNDPALADGGAGSGVAGYSASQTFNTTGTHAYSGTATDRADNQSAAATGSVMVDATDPTVGITGCPSAPVLLKSSQSITVTAGDVGSGLVTDPSGSLALETTSVGAKTRTVQVEDKVGHTKSATCSYSVIYDWSGFFQPIDNSGVFNTANAGRTIPVKFSLAGDQGLNVLAAGSPSSIAVACPSATAPQDAVEETSTATSGLKYDAVANQYVYNWKTPTTYANTCRQLSLKLVDGTVHTALFKFTR